MKRSRGVETLEEDTLGIGEVGAFVDTVGSIGHLEEDSSEGEGEGGGRSTEPWSGGLLSDDEVEERLKNVVFGKQPFHTSSLNARRSRDSETEDTEDEGEELVGEWPRTGLSQRSRFEREPAWQDDDDARIR